MIRGGEKEKSKRKRGKTQQKAGKNDAPKEADHNQR